jgi:type II secretory pathway component PulF
MKYTYAYKTSDGVRHEDSMNASSREEVFAELRNLGIKTVGLNDE